MRFPSGYGISVGLLMILQWTITVAAGAVPEFETAPVEIAFHLAAEFTTASMLLAGGVATLKTLSWGKPVLLTGLGMVIYSEIASPGYYAQSGQWGFVAMFAILLFGAVRSVMLLLKHVK